jgi:RHS repeat-associated protein
VKSQNFPQTLIAQYREGAWSYVLHDGLGSVRQATDAEAEISAVYSFDPFGTLLGSSGGNPYGYTGELWDSQTQLLYLRARHYSPEIGRFVSKDSFPGLATEPQTLNRFVYGTNNPVIHTDPSGHIGPLVALGLGLVFAGILLLVTADTPLPPEQCPPDIQGYVGWALLVLGAAPYLAPQIMAAASADGDPTNELQAAADVLCADGDCTNEARSIWDLHPWERGVKIEEALGRSPELVQNFPTIDRFEDGVATSIKSINLAGKSYQNISNLNRAVKSYIDTMASYQGQPQPWGGVSIESWEITGRAVDLAVPASGVTNAQLNALQNLQQYAQSVDVTLNIIRVY